MHREEENHPNDSNVKDSSINANKENLVRSGKSKADIKREKDQELNSSCGGNLSKDVFIETPTKVRDITPNVPWLKSRAPSTTDFHAIVSVPKFVGTNEQDEKRKELKASSISQTTRETTPERARGKLYDINEPKPSDSNHRNLFYDLPSSSVPGNLHLSSDQAISRYIERYSAVEVIRQLATDLAEREAEVGLLRRQCEDRERELKKIIVSCGISMSDIEKRLFNITSTSIRRPDAVLDELMDEAINTDMDGSNEVISSINEHNIYSDSHDGRDVLSDDASQKIKRSWIDSLLGLREQRAHTQSLREDDQSSLLSSLSSTSVLSPPPESSHSHRSRGGTISSGYNNQILSSSSSVQDKVPLELEDIVPQNIQPPTLREPHVPGVLTDRYGFIYNNNRSKERSDVKNPFSEDNVLSKNYDNNNNENDNISIPYRKESMTNYIPTPSTDGNTEPSSESFTEPYKTLAASKLSPSLTVTNASNSKDQDVEEVPDLDLDVVPKTTSNFRVITGKTGITLATYGDSKGFNSNNHSTNNRKSNYNDTKDSNKINNSNNNTNNNSMNIYENNDSNNNIYSNKSCTTDTKGHSQSIVGISKSTPSRSTTDRSTGSESVKILLAHLSELHDGQQKQLTAKWDDFLNNKLDSRNIETGQLLGISGSGLIQSGLFKEFKELVLGGVPVAYRPKIWGECSGAWTLKEPGSYEELVERRDETEAMVQIDLDLHRTMPYNVFFGGKGPGITKLRRVLVAFSRRNPEVGYCQGMNLIAAILLLTYATEENAFWSLVSMVENILPEGYFSSPLLTARADQRVLCIYFKQFMPKLFEHVISIGVEIEIITFDWFLSCFTDVLPPEVLFRVWDVFLCIEGEVYLFKVALSLFKIHESELFSINSASDMYAFMKGLMNHPIQVETVIRTSNQFVIDSKNAKQLRTIELESMQKEMCFRNDG